MNSPTPAPLDNSVIILDDDVTFTPPGTPDATWELCLDSEQRHLDFGNSGFTSAKELLLLSKKTAKFESEQRLRKTIDYLITEPVCTAFAAEAFNFSKRELRDLLTRNWSDYGFDISSGAGCDCDHHLSQHCEKCCLVYRQHFNCKHNVTYSVYINPFELKRGYDLYLADLQVAFEEFESDGTPFTFDILCKRDSTLVNFCEVDFNRWYHAESRDDSIFSKCPDLKWMYDPDDCDCDDDTEELAVIVASILKKRPASFSYDVDPKRIKQ